MVIFPTASYALTVIVYVAAVLLGTFQLQLYDDVVSVHKSVEPTINVTFVTPILSDAVAVMVIVLPFLTLLLLSGLVIVNDGAETSINGVGVRVGVGVDVGTGVFVGIAMVAVGIGVLVAVGATVTVGVGVAVGVMNEVNG